MVIGCRRFRQFRWYPHRVGPRPPYRVSQGRTPKHSFVLPHEGGRDVPFLEGTGGALQASVPTRTAAECTPVLRLTGPVVITSSTVRGGVASGLRAEVLSCAGLRETTKPTWLIWVP